MTIDLSQFHATFLEESLEGIDIMESSLLDLNVGDKDPDVINTIFRAAHSIKGGSGTFGFMEISEFTHVQETLLDEIRSAKRDATQDIINTLLESVDCVREMLFAEKDKREYDKDHISSVRVKLENILFDSDKATAANIVKEDVQAVDEQGWKIIFKPHLGMIKTGNDPVRILRELSSLGFMEVQVNVDELPVFSRLDPESCYLSWDIDLFGDVEEGVVREVFDWVDDDCDLTIHPLPKVYIPIQKIELSGNNDTDKQALEETRIAIEAPVVNAVAQHVADSAQDLATNKKRVNSVTESSSIRVSTQKVDELINLVGELVITQSMIGQLGQNFDVSKIERMMDGLSQLERHTRELQESVMRIRMLPISFSFNRFPRMVHDLGNKLGKKIELKMSGENTELDKTVLEKIGDPLVHLVRNSLDHGLETPECRKAAGKPEIGVLHLNAYHKGGSIIIEISDDGAGLNREKIRNRALQSGLITEDEVLSDERIYDLIFQPGFSTVDEVSDVSGRGVGMDVVRKNIRELGGAVDIASTPGKGSIITIRLPLTLAIMDGQLVRVGNDTYIIPLVSIIESLQAREENIKTIVDHAEVYRLREEYIHIVRLHEIFQLEPDTHDINNGLLVMVEAEGRKVGLFVDELYGQQQVVIKSLETNYRRIDGVSGATILGDGTVAMILDVAGLVAMSRSKMINVVDNKVA